jgi:thymidine kinase
MAPLKSSLTIFLGPMYAGKTTEMATQCHLYAKAERSSIIVKYAGDTRYSDKEEVVTHDQEKYVACSASKLGDVLDTLLQHEVIGIDEGSFYPDIVPVVKTLLQNDKVVIVSILDGAYTGDVFSMPNILLMLEYQKLAALPDPMESLLFLRDNLQALTTSWTSLIPLADNVIKCHGVCSCCGTMGSGMTLKINPGNGQVVDIGGDEKYITACRACWWENGNGSGQYHPLANSI